MILVLEFQTTDNATYWTNDIIFIEHESIEDAYVKIHDTVKYACEAHNLKTEEAFQNFYITINNEDVSLDNFIDSKGEIDIGIITLEQYIKNISKNANPLEIK